MRLSDFIEPEETVGNLWHDWASKLDPETQYVEAMVSFEEMQSSIGVLFRALGGDAGVDIGASAGQVAQHRKLVLDKLTAKERRDYSANFDGERLRLPPVIASFPSKQLNRKLYLWLATSAALCDDSDFDNLADGLSPQAQDYVQILINSRLRARIEVEAPGLYAYYPEMSASIAEMRKTATRNQAEREMERSIQAVLAGESLDTTLPQEHSAYKPFAPVALWLTLSRPQSGSPSTAEHEADSKNMTSAIASSLKKQGERKDQDQTNRRDSFIMHRFESILSWAESLNINRHVDDDDEDNVQKAADDQDRITLSKQRKKAATRLRLHLDLSPEDAEHEALAGRFIYPEWNARTASYMQDHCCVLEMPAEAGTEETEQDFRRQKAAAKQFEHFRPRRVLTPRALDGDQLDLDALVESRCDMAASGEGTDRIWRDSRQIERDLAVAFLLDTSRSTEASMGERTVLDTARSALASFAYGVDSIGDRLGIWSFSSLKRDRVFVSQIKNFDEMMDKDVSARLAGLTPGHYTRLGAAIRHVSAKLAEEPAERRLLVVLTDGKPNDLDHYEGRHGIEDSHKAVHEARAKGQNVFGIIIDEDGQDWFQRIFSRGGFALLPNPERLSRALPEIYKNLTMEE